MAPLTTADFRWPDDVYWSNAFGLQPLHKLRHPQHAESPHQVPSPDTTESKAEEKVSDDVSVTKTKTSSSPGSSDEALSLPTESPQLVHLLQSPQESSVTEQKATQAHKRKHPEVIEVAETVEENTATSPSLDEGSGNQEDKESPKVADAATLGDNTATPSILYHRQQHS